MGSLPLGRCLPLSDDDQSARSPSLACGLPVDKYVQLFTNGCVKSVYVTLLSFLNSFKMNVIQI